MRLSGTKDFRLKFQSDEMISMNAHIEKSFLLFREFLAY
ncbi:hypothetical protein ASZ90_012544 [hydrocarbon metagenome]|uniref:Uncharacterized protein n=1 Tax=hydrocarbon metagenome TaxID=938273 RepID=A0A0W8FA79_9ZZZZ